MDNLVLTSPDGTARRRAPAKPRAKSDKIRMAGQLTAESSEWYTPGYILDAAREALGGDFDLDPASCEIANRVVRARHIFTVADNGLTKPWGGRVWCNPPNPPRLWWECMAGLRSGQQGAGVYLSYSKEPLQQSQRWGASMMDFTFCVPMRRITFLSTAADALARHRKYLSKKLAKEAKGPTKGEQAELDRLLALDPTELVDGEQPTHASALVLVGGDPERFARAFASIGATKR